MYQGQYNSSLIGQRVYVQDIPHWLTKPIKEGHCRLVRYMAGKIIGSTIAMDKIAVEFDDRIWNDTGKATAYGRKIMCGSTEFTTDANGKGKPGHCAYFYPLQVQLFSSNPAKKDIQSALDRKKLLLLSL